MTPLVEWFQAAVDLVKSATQLLLSLKYTYNLTKLCFELSAELSMLSLFMENMGNIRYEISDFHLLLGPL